MKLNKTTELIVALFYVHKQIFVCLYVCMCVFVCVCVRVCVCVCVMLIFNNEDGE